MSFCRFDIMMRDRAQARVCQPKFNRKAQKSAMLKKNDSNQRIRDAQWYEFALLFNIHNSGE
jgi:hypothetical protein